MWKHDIINKINSLDIAHLKEEYHNHPQYGLINIPEFLPKDITDTCSQELQDLPLTKMKHFTRKGSCMYECNDLNITPCQDHLVHALHSTEFIHWLEELTGVKKLIADPHLVGAGYMKSFKGDSLQVHTDFNWVEELCLNRAVSIIVYFNRDWNKEWGGSLNFYDTKKQKIHSSIKPDAGNMLIWTYKNLVYHGYPDPMTCPDNECRRGMRLFYLTSDAKTDPKNLPHRSLYWFDEETGLPYDKKEQN
jgi:Rps23 Pro-64 3,4-dihydroxylase Tpa1-like proline 4-hydroxylase|tara:strand:- start:317 stop:1060 length:744 start_codon:yes stop_codon:yes gene_type:complete